MKLSVVYCIFLLVASSCALEGEESLFIDEDADDYTNEPLKDPATDFEKATCNASADCGGGLTISCTSEGDGECSDANSVSGSLQITKLIGSCYPDEWPHGRYKVYEVGSSRGYINCHGYVEHCPSNSTQSFQWSTNYGTLDVFPPNEVYHHASSSYPFTLFVTANNGLTTSRSFTPNGTGSCESDGGGGGGPF